MINWRKHLKVTAKTTEDRLWDFVGEQAKSLVEIALSDGDLEQKKQSAEAPYRSIREALKQLGIVR
jgi:hypothetical protein